MNRERPHRFNAWLLVLGAILVYLLITLIMYITSGNIHSYEVKTGYLSRTSSYTGLVLRRETVIHADLSGGLSYYQPEASKVKVGSSVCMIDTLNSGASSVSAGENGGEVSYDYSQLIRASLSFREGFSENRFEEAYSFHRQAAGLMNDMRNMDLLAGLDAMANADPSAYILQKAPVDGILAYHIDGGEGLDSASVSADAFERSRYNETDLRKKDSVAAGDAIYKIITSEEWQICVPLDEDTYNYLKDDTPSEIQVRIRKDNSQIWGDLELADRDGQHLAILSFDQAVVRYASDRFLDITLILENETGLKIPRSAVVTKDFFLVPSDFLTRGGNSGDNGVLVADSSSGSESGAVFHKTDVYRIDPDTGMVYVDSSVLSEGDILIAPDSSETYAVMEKASLKGVYNVNKGYAKFKQIEILTENEEYCIVKEGTSYGIANFDYIALDGSKVREDDILR